MRIYRRPSGDLELDYLRPGAMGVFKCGSMHALTDLGDVLGWLVDLPFQQV